jgi:hypothetical protein
MQDRQMQKLHLNDLTGRVYNVYSVMMMMMMMMMMTTTTTMSWYCTVASEASEEKHKFLTVGKAGSPAGILKGYSRNKM